MGNIERCEDDDLLVCRAGDGISLVVERGDGNPVRVPKGETHRYVSADQLKGAVEALWRIADHSLPPEHDDLQEYAVAVLQALGVDLATYRPGGQ